MWSRPLLLALVASSACKAEPKTVGDDDDDTTTTEPECAVDEECRALLEICEEGECVRGDRDDELGSANPLFQGDDQAVSGVIGTDGDIDVYAYESPGDEWISVRTVVSDAEVIDTVVSVLRSNGALHAVMDDFPVWPFRVTGYDTVLYVYLPDPGTWYLQVEDATSYYGDPPRSGPDLAYEVLVRASGGTSEPDGPTDPASTLELPDGGTIISIGVLIDEPGDVDYLDIEHPSDELLEVWGEVGIEGSEAVAEVQLFDESGDRVATKTDLGPSGWLSWLEAREGTYRLEVTDADGNGSKDHWFPVFARTYEPGDSHPFFADNEYLPEEPEPNELLPAAIPRDVETDDEGTYDAFRVAGRVDEAADRDPYAIGTAPGQTVTVRCWTDRFGSEAKLEVALAADGVEVERGGVADEDFYLQDVVAPEGELELWVEAAAGSAVGAAGWYRCAAFVR